MRQIEYQSPVPPYRLLLTGHYREPAGYRTRRSRGSEDWLLILTLSGQGRFGYAGGDLPARPGDITLIAPGTPHDYGIARGAPAWELLWAHFHPRPHWVEWLDWPVVAPGLMQLSLREREEYSEIRGRLSEANRLAQRGGPQGELLAMAALEEALIWCHGANPKTARIDPRVQSAMEYIREHIGEPITLPALAASAGLSPSRFGRLFRAETGKSPQQHIESLRLETARQLLDLTNRSVGAIASAVGYESAFYFSLRFKRATGQSPSEYRRR
jgi:AraC family transcriptional regulator of arabinose operon